MSFLFLDQFENIYLNCLKNLSVLHTDSDAEKLYVLFLLLGLVLGYLLKDRKNSFIQINLYCSLNSNNFNHNGNDNLSNNEGNQDNLNNNGNDNGNGNATVDNQQNTDIQGNLSNQPQDEEESIYN
ncbi:MAG: hypothetical protein ACFB02_20000 [Mastigocoleus sp.]